MEKKELSFFEKVGAVQAELKAPKGQFNKFGGYAYRSCEDILEAVKPLLNKYGLVLVVGDELVEMGGRIYVKATARLLDAEWNEVSNTAFAREEETKKGMDGSQITGASSSYARKYALNGLFLIDDTKDSDATNTHGKEEVKEEKKEEKKEAKKEMPKASEKQVSLIMTLVPEENRPKMLEYYKVKKIEDLTIEQASEIITKKSNKKEEK